MSALITRRHITTGSRSTATYSPCETYRYALTRIWNQDGKHLTYIMLNPSKATERDNDPTIERCQRRAAALGFGGFSAVNLFALRETDPAKMRRHPAPCGPQNENQLIDFAERADMILCAWGVHGIHLEQDKRTIKLLKTSALELHVLGLTKAGHPRHPLYMPYSTQPQIWTP